jgi:hypothetical protein
MFSGSQKPSLGLENAILNGLDVTLRIMVCDDGSHKVLSLDQALQGYDSPEQKIEFIANCSKTGPVVVFATETFA